MSGKKTIAQQKAANFMAKCAWSTDSEIRFLKRIGDALQEHLRVGKKQLLDGYIRGSARRIDWGDIDKDKCVAYAHQLLRALP